MIEKHYCDFCKQEHIIKSGPNEDLNTKKSRGGQASMLSKIITHEAHSAAMNPKQISEFCDYSGMVHPSDRGLHKMHRKRKDLVKIVYRGILRLNAIEHNKA